MSDTRLKIMAMGGGNMLLGETRRIDRRVVELTGKSHPRAVFLPTAKGDDEGYCEAFAKVYGDELGCEVRALRLLRHRPSRSTTAALIRQADIVYVGGGNTLRMMKRWRRLGVDRLLRAAARRGAVMCGLSAGAICWFSFGHSDSLAYAGRNDWTYIRVRGLGLIDALFCPHYHAENREDVLAEMVTRRGGPALACDNNTAIEILGTHWRVFRSRRNGKAYRLVRRRGTAVVERLPADHAFRPLSQLLSPAPVFSGSGRQDGPGSCSRR